MSRTERKVRDLVEDDPTMEDAIAVVMQRSGDNGKGVTWGDVSDDISSGQWGRMIEKGVVVDDEDGGFRLNDPDAVEEALSEDTKAAAETTVDIDDDGIEPTGWSTYDKLAGLGVLVLMSGYYFSPVKNLIGAVLGTVLNPLDQFLPFYLVILVLAMATAVYSTVLMSNLMNSELIQKQQQRMQALRDRKEEAKERDDDAALEKIKDEEMDMMSDQMSMFKEQFRPMVWVTLITIPVFLWMYFTIQPGQAATTIHGAEPVIGVGGTDHIGMVLPMVGKVHWNTGVLGPLQAWIAWYFLCSMGFSQLIRKSVGLQTTPTA
jgi:uncharacterized membrane protein (DUF106 family)